ncbi:MAG TPA: hypothetical protein PKW73_12265, partial [Candidatus Obscuribacter sp.]|nr:hypothetical protein [Candidatus Obscuribacter sp.]
INNLLDIARMESGSLQLHYAEVTAAELIAPAFEQVTLLAEDRQLRLVSQVAADVPAFRVDVDLLSRVLVNLLGNAIKYSPADTTVYLGQRHTGHPRIG